MLACRLLLVICASVSSDLKVLYKSVIISSSLNTKTGFFLKLFLKIFVYLFYFIYYYYLTFFNLPRPAATAAATAATATA